MEFLVRIIFNIIPFRLSRALTESMTGRVHYIVERITCRKKRKNPKYVL